MPTVIHWFRHDLRLHDNPALRAGGLAVETVWQFSLLDLDGLP